MKRKNTQIPAVLGVALALLVGACVPQQQTAAVGPSLAGNWQVMSLVGGALPGGANVTIGFAGPTVSGSSGCNGYSGSFTQTGNNLTIGPLAMTKKACPPQLMDVEAGFSTALTAVTRYDVVDGTLQLYVGNSLIMQARRQ